MKKALYITIIGAPNVGKSSLINYLTQLPYCTVSSKAHTTKTSVYTILNIENTQLIFIDTPGLSQENTGAYSQLNKIATAECNIEAPHVILFLLESNKNIPAHIEYLIHKYKDKNKIVVMTKIDKRHRDKYLENTTQLKDLVNDVFITSAYTGKGIQSLLQYLVSESKEYEWPYSSTFQTNITENTMIKNRIREACFENLYHEIPHNIEIEYGIDNNRCDVILYCTESQKPIILTNIKNISMLSRQKVQEIMPDIKSLYIKVKLFK